VKLGIVRNGSPQTVTAKIVQQTGPMLDGKILLPAPAQPFNLLLPDIPRSLMTWRSTLLGIEGESLDGQLAEFFGVKDGVLVRSVIKGSAADKAGIKTGDVITRIEEMRVTTPAEISNRLRAARGKSVSVGLTRDHKDVSLTVTIPQREERTIG